jgi:hypothetical protein
MASLGLIVETNVAIARQPEAVFDVLADPSKWSDLDAALVEVVPRERLALGSSGMVRRRVGPGLTVRTAWEITAFVPGARFENLIAGFGYELRETVVLAADAIGAQVAVVDTLVPTSLVGRAMVAVSRRIIERDLHARCAKLKSLLEAGSASAD